MAISEYISTAEVEAILTEVIDKFLIPHFIELGMRASGEWEDNIQAVGASIWGRDYTEQLIYGRKPGKFAPIQPLIEWVGHKFGVYGQEAISIAWAVNHKIKNEGTNYYQQGGTDLLSFLSSDIVTDFISKSIGDILKENVTFDIRRRLRGI